MKPVILQLSNAANIQTHTIDITNLAIELVKIIDKQNIDKNTLLNCTVTIEKI